MSKFFTALIIFFLLGASPQLSFAQDLAPEVATPYKNVDTALEKKDYIKARKQAYAAWQAAEKIYGNKKITGELAYIYGTIGLKINDQKYRGKTRKALERSIEIPKAKNSKPAQKIAYKRMQQYIIYLGSISNKDAMIEAALQAEAFGKETGLEQSPSNTRFLIDLGNVFFTAKDYKKATRYFDQALKTYEKAGKGKSKDAYIAMYSKARTLYKREDWLNAAVLFEKVYVNADDALEPNNMFIGRAYIGSQRAKYNSNYAKTRPSPYIKYDGPLCNLCWPNSKKDMFLSRPALKDVELQRFAPVMPRNARGSGFVVVKYDLDENGKTKNIGIITGSDLPVFADASLRAVKGWRADFKGKSIPKDQRTGLVTTLFFFLTGSKGRLIDLNGYYFQF